jgi:hypothetical protein
MSVHCICYFLSVLFEFFLLLDFLLLLLVVLLEEGVRFDALFVVLLEPSSERVGDERTLLDDRLPLDDRELLLGLVV